MSHTPHRPLPRRFPFRSCVLLPLAALGLQLGPVLAGTAPAQAADVATPPYWVTLRKDQTNMRVGPGREYRINWVYVRPGLPMKVLRAMEGWVLVEDPDGARGWVMTQFVARKPRMAVVKGGIAEIRGTPDGSGPLLWRAEPGVLAKLGDCASGWCKVDIGGRQGFAAQDHLWGAAAL